LVVGVGAQGAFGFGQVSGSPFAAAVSPEAVTFSPNGDFLAASNDEADSVSVFSVNGTTGALKEVSGSPFATGYQAAGVAFSPNGELLAVPSYDSGNVSVFLVNQSTGALRAAAGSPFPVPGPGGSADSVSFTPKGQFLATADGNFGGGGISVFSVNGTTGALKEVSGSPFAAGDGPISAQFSPTGTFLAADNTLSGDISLYSVNGSTGALTQVLGSPFAAEGAPRELAFSPSGGFLASVNNLGAVINGKGIVQVFSVNSSTGALTPLAKVFGKKYGPKALAYSPSGSMLVTGDLEANTVAAFTVKTDGKLKKIAGTPFSTGSGTLPFGVAFSPSGAFAAVADSSGKGVSVFSTAP
jgi:6-phosphogluconolactonase (cycloisomerase 2 family)